MGYIIQRGRGGKQLVSPVERFSHELWKMCRGTPKAGAGECGKDGYSLASEAVSEIPRRFAASE